eukprot:m.276792 g.276792  ORF g.276792 m.276792 type:complete len:64 (-) comp126374_c0_seq1:193-384(-)
MFNDCMTKIKKSKKNRKNQTEQQNQIGIRQPSPHGQFLNALTLYRLSFPTTHSLTTTTIDREK